MPSNSKKPVKKLSWRQRVKKRIDDFLARRPHRSFRLTRRRDYARSLKLPGFFAFTFEVNRTVWGYRKHFLWLVVVYAILTAGLVGIGSQATYSNLTDTLRESSEEVFQGNLGELTKASLLFITVAGAGLSETPTEGQQIYSVLIGFLVWLTTVWLLRQLLAGNKVKLRDALYNAGSPIISTLLLGVVLVVQLIPVGIAVLGYSAASATGLLAGGVEAMLFWIGAALLGTLSLYLITTTFIAMIIITIPGMYPMRALKTAGDVVVGRRLRILVRLVWAGLCIAIAWALVLIPFILLDGWLKGMWPQVEWLPIIPVVILILGCVSIVWLASYVYLLYRKVVDDNAKPA